MKLTTKGKFAVTALLDIATNKSNKPITLKAISIRQNISLHYLEQLFLKLRKFDIVKSYKGPGGGYTLAMKLDELTILKIVKAVDEDMDARSCHGLKNCSANKKCLTHDFWNDLTVHVYSYLNNITLQDIINNQQKRNIIETTYLFR